MFIPSIPGIVDLTALQNAVALILLSDDRLKKVPVMPEFKLHTESDILVDILWTLPRNALQVTGGSVQVSTVVQDDVNAPVGCGLLVEMPEGQCNSPNVTGPPLTWKLSVVAFEQRNVNFTPDAGIGLTAEQLAQVVLDILHLQPIWDFGTLSMAKVPVGPASDWMEMKPGINAWRATLESTKGRQQSPRTPPVGCVAGNDGLVTLTCADPNAEIYFTTDGSAPVVANPAAVKYNQPFPKTSGALLLVSSRKNGNVLSALSGYSLP